jgi:hypothetical protein
MLVSFQDISKELNTLNSGFRQLEIELPSYKEMTVPSKDRFYEVMSSFMEQHKFEFEQVEKEYSKVYDLYMETVIFLGDDPMTLNSMDFFSIIKEFIIQFQVNDGVFLLLIQFFICFFLH